ncbi:hypothetical protein AGMMS49574_13920 [Bacteroidia bacterium]|nr:hypothetical protein AGMMS49574_13920 [Bacteroidia bacterium]
MKKGITNLDELKGKNPFRVPEGYFESLTTQIMEQLPEKRLPEPVKVSLVNRMLPWVYLAAMIAGLGFFFKVLNIGDENASKPSASESFLVQSNTPDGAYSAIDEEEDLDYLDYLESQYVSYALAEKMGNFE